MISVILSAYNEASNPYFWQTLVNIKCLAEKGFPIEAVVGATKGSDVTLERLQKLKVNFVEIDTSMRGVRYNQALKAASSKEDDWIVLHHPRSLLDSQGFLSLSSLPDRLHWGAFTHRFDLHHPLLSFTSWWSNQVRGDLKKIFYLDHCLFVRRGIFEKVGGFPEREIFEDTELSLKLGYLSHPLRLPWTSTTSSLRFTQNGIWKQASQNQLRKCQFLLGLNDKKINQAYEAGMYLNCSKSKD